MLEEILDTEMRTFKQRSLMMTFILYALVDYIDAPQVFLMMFIAIPQDAFKVNPYADGARTIGTEWNFTDSYLTWVTGFLQSIFFVGFMFGTTFCGQLSDSLGRKRVSFWVYMVVISSSLLAGLTQNWMQLAACRLVSGFCVGGLSVINFILVQEAASKSAWVPLGICSSTVFGVLMLAAEAVAYFFPDWRTFCVVSTLPAVFGFTFYFLQPESPRWLSTRGRRGSAFSVVATLARRNGHQLTEKQYDAYIASEPMENDVLRNRTNGSFTDILTHPILRKRTFVLGFLWFTTGFVFYCITLGAGAFSSNFYIAFAGSAISQLPSAPLCHYFMNKKSWGRKRTMTGFMIIASLSMVATFVLFGLKEMYGYRLLLSMTAKVGVQGAFTLLYVYTPELYPTTVRNVGLGFMSTMARIGCMLAPFVANYTVTYQMRIPYLVYSVVCTIAAYLVLFLPETLDCKIINTIEELYNRR